MKSPDAGVQPYKPLLDEERQAICEQLSKCGSLSESIRLTVGQERSSTVYAAARNDPLQFGAAIDHAREQFRNTIRNAIREKATGFSKELVFQGVRTGDVTTDNWDKDCLLALARMNLPEFVDKKSNGDIRVSGSVQIESQPGIWTISDSEAMALSAEGKRMLALVLREVIKNRRQIAREENHFAALTDQSNIADAEFIEVAADDPYDMAQVEALR